MAQTSAHAKYLNNKINKLKEEPRKTVPEKV